MKYLTEYILIGITLLAMASLVMGDGEQEEHMRGVSAPKHAEYQAECGACHLAYPPALLPASSWQTLMDGLADHFGDNAELPADSAARIREYLLSNAADRGLFGWNSPAKGPLRITETSWFRHQHHELPRRLAQDNPKVGSLSNCQACHRRAESASFNEHQVNIPGYGPWDD